MKSLEYSARLFLDVLKTVKEGIHIIVLGLEKL